MTSFGKNGGKNGNDPNMQLRVGGIGMTDVQGTGQTGIRASAKGKAILGNSKAAQSFPRDGMTPVSICSLSSLCLSTRIATNRVD